MDTNTVAQTELSSQHLPIELYAQPYDISARGFYFSTVEEFTTQASHIINSSGGPVEEFDIQFIDGDKLDSALFEALGIDPGNLSKFLETASTWSEDEKIEVIIGVREYGHTFDLSKDEPEKFIEQHDIVVYRLHSLEKLAEQFVDEGMLGAIPKAALSYIDYDAYAYDLSMEYRVIVVSNEISCVYRLN